MLVLDQYGYKRGSMIPPRRRIRVDPKDRKNYRKPLLQRYVIRILLMYVGNTLGGRSPLNNIRVPIYSASSWASIMSQDAAFYLDPLRDIYEVSHAIHEVAESRYIWPLTNISGFHDIYFLPTPNQLPRRRAFTHYYDAWKAARPASLAYGLLSC